MTHSNFGTPGDISPEEATCRATALQASLEDADDWRPRLASTLAEMHQITAATGGVAAARVALLKAFEVESPSSLMAGASRFKVLHSCV